MRLFNAIRRLITNPLSAALICGVGGCALWFYLAPQRAGRPTANVNGTALAAVAASQPDDRASNVRPTKSAGRAVKKRPGSGRIDSATIVAATRGDAREYSDLRVEHFEAENEPIDPTPKPTAVGQIDRPPQETKTASASSSTVDTIGPHDPRAKALADYQTKKATTADTVAAQKQLALWCDQEGLWDAAKTHWRAVIRLDSKNEDARKRLGYRFRDRDWVFDPGRADNVAQTKANRYWTKAIPRLHTKMNCKSKRPVPGRAEAIAQIESIGDPRAATAIWKFFAGDISHHGLVVEILSRFNTPDASRILAGIAVYSRDVKAQATAVAALRGRPAAEYGEKLVTLMQAPMRVEEHQVPVPGGAPARMLFVEGDTQNYQFVFSREQAPTAGSLQGCFLPQLGASDIAMARQFNENQTEIAKQALNQQVAWAKAMIQKYNDSIQSLNERVAYVLNAACGAQIQPRPEDGRRWLTATLGTQYRPDSDLPKPTVTEIVAPLYSPTFLPIPVAT